MKRYRIVHNQAVWERSSWTVEAETAEEALDRFYDGEAELEWAEGNGAVELVDDDVESVTEIG